MAEPADIRAAQALLGRRVAIVEDGRAAIDDILARNEAGPALGRAAAGYFCTFEIELDQNAVQLQAADLLLDADKVDLAAARYRTLQAEQEHELLQRRVRELEREKFVAMQATNWNVRSSSPCRRCWSRTSRRPRLRGAELLISQYISFDAPANALGFAFSNGVRTVLGGTF